MSARTIEGGGQPPARFCDGLSVLRARRIALLRELDGLDHAIELIEAAHDGEAGDASNVVALRPGIDHTAGGQP